jgi:hypothetical protein
MKVLGIDPSSTRTGYAILTGLEPADLLEAGYLTPARTKDTANQRIDAMVADLETLLKEQEPVIDVVVIEASSGKVGKRHKGGGAGLAIYGQAIGELRRAVLAIMPPEYSGGRGRVVMVPENEWTRSRPKGERNAGIAAIYPAYAAEVCHDTGGDVGDAIGIARWWITTEQLVRSAR